MTIVDWAAFAISICTLVGTFALMIKWLVKHYLVELKANGGSSMRDSVDVNSKRLERLELRVDEIYRLLVK
ncbi:hypothetical protein UFOVP999_55 [uncultured Caudovirales phage]|uniref:Uncharacterized protein n=1 Tax=uncultured Caudovirales phage TaxID=2100421 RepID=A0A6J5QCP3_9CAUD|nr:hypothetical protein UFOVP999_55 [uncultured Caudovirales phage]